MLKTDVIAHFGTQKRVADALTAEGFKITPRGVSAWPQIVPLKNAVPLSKIMGRELDLSVYRGRQ